MKNTQIIKSKQLSAAVLMVNNNSDWTFFQSNNIITKLCIFVITIAWGRIQPPSFTQNKYLNKLKLTFRINSTFILPETKIICNTKNKNNIYRYLIINVLIKFKYYNIIIVCVFKLPLLLLYFSIFFLISLNKCHIDGEIITR